MRNFDFESTSRLIIGWFIFCAVMGIGFCIGIVYLVIELAQYLSRH